MSHTCTHNFIYFFEVPFQCHDVKPMLYNKPLYTLLDLNGYRAVIHSQSCASDLDWNYLASFIASSTWLPHESALGWWVDYELAGPPLKQCISVACVSIFYQDRLESQSSGGCRSISRSSERESCNMQGFSSLCLDHIC